MSDENDEIGPGAEGGPPRASGPTISVEQEMRRSYLDYAMSVVVSRAIPDLRDGLKPVHRRILFSMQQNGFTHDKPYRKSARVVGDVIGKYHPHGDQSVYDALVRMAQDFSMRLPLLDGQGNFGSMDADPPAAMRYTEVRMDRPASFLLADLDKETVDFQPNYDGQDREPVVMPARFPNLLVNGAGGIAVGMATNIPPHNLGEVIDACQALIENPDLSVPELMEHVPAPDFPTGALIVGRSGARAAYMTGRGSVVMRAKTKIEEIRRDRWAIIIEEMPYQVNKATLVERIAELAREKKIEGVAHVQDESDRFGVRVVIELRRDATPDVVLNQLYRFTPMQTSFGCNMLALNAGKPEQLDLRGILVNFLAFREEVIARRTAFELRKARERAHTLCGLAVAVSNVDEVVRLIRGSADAAEARGKLMARRWPAQDIAPYIRLIDDPTHRINEDGTYNLSDAQARAILDLRLQRLTALGVKEVTDELESLAARIADYLDILRSRERILGIVSAELAEVRELFATPRRTEIVEQEGEVDDEALIEREDMVVTVTHGGYVKRTPLSEYRAQARGGKGLGGIAMKDEDFVTTLFVANTHTPILVFTSDGIAYKLKTWRLPVGGRNARGRPIVNVLPVKPGVGVAAMMPVDAPEETWSALQIVFATSNGMVRRNALSDFINVKANGKIAMRLPDEVRLVGARICDDEKDLLLVTGGGRAVRIHLGARDAEGSYRTRIFAGRESLGVRGVRLAAGDAVVSMAVLRHFETTPEERGAYLKMRRAVAGPIAEEEDDAQIDEDGSDDEATADMALPQERYAEMSAAEEMILTITSKGLGKRTSSHAYRVIGRGGAGILAADLTPRKNDPDRAPARIVAAFPAAEEDQIMLVTDAGQSIRCPVAGVSEVSRTARGVRVMNTAPGERVVSVALIAEENGGD